VPARFPSGLQHNDPAFALQILHCLPDSLAADAGTFRGEIGHGKGFGQGLEGFKDALALFPPRRLDPSGPGLEFLVGNLENEQEMVYQGPGIIGTFMPAR